jgi:hypothetical protein
VYTVAASRLLLIAQLLLPAKAGGSISPPEHVLFSLNSWACSSLCGGSCCCSSVVPVGSDCPHSFLRIVLLESWHCSAVLVAHSQLNGWGGCAGLLLLLMVPLIAPIWLPLLRLWYVQRVGRCAVPFRAVGREGEVCMRVIGELLWSAGKCCATA